jgi:hypothetical protein
VCDKSYLAKAFTETVDQLMLAQERIEKLEARIAELTVLLNDADLALDTISDALAETPNLHIRPN